jgi:mannosyltransferase
MPGGARAVPAAGTGPAHGTSTPGRPQLPGRPGARGVPGWVPLLIPGIVLLLADGYDLGRLSLWRDEAYTVDAANRPLPRILAMLGHTDAVNGAYYLFMHAGIAVAGTSATALRLPSLAAMAVAAVVTAAIGRRLARAGRLPAPALTGVVAGLLFAATPQVTRYAQDARSYGLVTMCATIATYLLLRALADDRRRWWAGYAVTITAAGLFSLLAFLLVAAHGTSVWLARTRQRAAARGGPAAPGPAPAVPVSRWLAAVAAAAVVASPLLAAGFGQRKQIGWMTRPGLHAVSHLLVSFAGSQLLLPLLALLVLTGVIASVTDRPRAAVDMVTVALPWLVLPAAVLLALSQIHPVYDARYVVFCLPALALLGATGLAWLTRFAAMIPVRKARGAVAWLPAALVLVLLAALVAGPQRSVRLGSSRLADLRGAAAVLAAHRRPGDAVLYVPASERVFGMAYPAPFRRLRDVALAQSPVAADNLIGTEVPAVTLRARFAAVGRVWVVSGREMFPHPASGMERAEAALLTPFRLVQRWRMGQGMLSLYRRG